MNKKMRELLAKIEAKQALAKGYTEEGENKDIEKAKAILNEIKALKEEYEVEKELFENEKEANKINEEELLLRYQNELAGLSLTNQRVIAMYLEGYTLLEIAIQTNKSPRTVYSQLDSSIDKLQKQGQDEVVLKLEMKRKKRKGK